MQRTFIFGRKQRGRQDRNFIYRRKQNESQLTTNVALFLEHPVTSAPQSNVYCQSLSTT